MMVIFGNLLEQFLTFKEWWIYAYVWKEKTVVELMYEGDADEDGKGWISWTHNEG